MEIKRRGSQPSSKGPAEWFTGDVIVDPLFKAPEPARVRGASVTFAPGPLRGIVSRSGAGRQPRFAAA
jgi:quercetin dioxygenase-like cupin family protein